MSSTPKAKRLKLAPTQKTPRATVPRILFVDDQPQLPHAIIRLLPCHVDSVVVTSGLRAIRELERGVFDLVVADLQMPGLTGSDLLILIKERWPATRRMLLTGHTSGVLLERATVYSEATLDKVLATEILTETICRLATEPRDP